MKIKIMPVLFGASLFFNAAFALLLATASLSKASHISFYDPKGGYVSSAAVASAPSTGEIAFNTVEIALRRGEKAYLQFSAFSGGKQGNILVNALYDTGVISVSQTGYGIEITALAEGSTLMQYLSNGGFKDLALVTVK